MKKVFTIVSHAPYARVQYKRNKKINKCHTRPLTVTSSGFLTNLCVPLLHYPCVRMCECYWHYEILYCYRHNWPSYFNAICKREQKLNIFCDGSTNFRSCTDQCMENNRVHTVLFNQHQFICQILYL